MKRSELSEFELEEEGFKLRLSRKNGEPPQIVHAGPMQQGGYPQPQQPGQVPGGSAASQAEEKEADTKSVIPSPMVGTFYRAPSPENDAFVDVGSEVEENTVVCIIEAMKVMNEIQAEKSGRITEILVENGETVEYGQPLFKLETV